MLDQDGVACSPSSVYRVRKAAGLRDRPTPRASSKGQGLVQPLRPHEPWHVAVSSLNLAGTFSSLGRLLDGSSRFTVPWEIRKARTEADVAQSIQRAREKFPGVTPRIIADNGPQFIARDFQEFIRLGGRTPARTCFAARTWRTRP